MKSDERHRLKENELAHTLTSLQEFVGPNARTLGAPEQYVFPISMGVRQGDEALKKRLDQVIADHQSELTAILTQYGVKLYTP